MNIYGILLHLFLLTGFHTSVVTSDDTPAFREVTLNWIQGNWKVYKAEQGSQRLYNREVFRFFEDETGLKGTNQRIQWKFQGNIIEIRVFENNKENCTYWWTTRDRANNLTLFRYATIRQNGMETVQPVKLILERIK